jgi:hypothetical protein
MTNMTQEMQDQLKAQSDLNFEMAIARQNVVGGLTGWRKLKDNRKGEKILKGRAKIMALVSR